MVVVDLGRARPAACMRMRQCANAPSSHPRHCTPPTHTHGQQPHSQPSQHPPRRRRGRRLQQGQNPAVQAQPAPPPPPQAAVVSSRKAASSQQRQPGDYRGSAAPASRPVPSSSSSSVAGQAAEAAAAAAPPRAASSCEESRGPFPRSLLYQRSQYGIVNATASDRKGACSSVNEDWAGRVNGLTLRAMAAGLTLARAPLLRFPHSSDNRKRSDWCPSQVGCG